MAHLPNLATCKKVGFIIPSSNTAVEPITQAIFQSLGADIVCLFTRIRVTTVGTDAGSRSQFSTDTLITAAKLLADAKPDAIVWNGTSGMWVGAGLEADRELAKEMHDAIGIPCSTTTLATVEALEACKATKLGIAVPYSEALTAVVQKFFSGLGSSSSITNSARLIPTPGSNLEIARTEMGEIEKVVRHAASPSVKDAPDAVIVACTNWPAAGLVEGLEKELGITIIDSVIVTIWHGLRMAGYKSRIDGWGRLMAGAL